MKRISQLKIVAILVSVIVTSQSYALFQAPAGINESKADEMAFVAKHPWKDIVLMINVYAKPGVAKSFLSNISRVASKLAPLAEAGDVDAFAKTYQEEFNVLAASLRRTAYKETIIRKYLLADKDKKTGFQLLHYAASCHTTDKIVNFLLEEQDGIKADVHALTANGDTPLHLAMQIDPRSVVVVALYAAGANPDKINSQLLSPKHLAMNKVMTEEKESLFSDTE